MRKRIEYKKYPRLNFWRRVGYFLLCFGGACFFLGGLGVISSLFGTKHELPLGELGGVAVDSAGNIYCGSQFYGVIQKYDPQGNFLSGFHVDSSGGVFRFRLNDKDELEVATARMDRFIRFSPEGEIVEQKQGGKDFYKEFGPDGDKECSGPDGSIYKIGGLSFLFPRVIKISPSGQRSTVISVPIHKWLIMGTLPAWLFFAIGVLLVGFSSSIICKKETTGASMKDFEEVNINADKRM